MILHFDLPRDIINSKLFVFWSGEERCFMLRPTYLRKG